MAGKISIINRYLLLYLFKPNLYFTFLFLTILILLHAAIAMACLYFIEAVLFGKIHILIILGIGFGAIVGIVIMIQASFSIIKKATINVVGKCLIEEENPLLWHKIKNFIKKIGTSLPNHIVVGLETNFFVTEANVFCLDGELSGKTMFISLPLCRILSVEEFEAVIAHELSHFKGMDTQFSKKFFPIYKGTIESLNGIAAHIEEGEAYVIALLPAFYMLSFFLWSFAVAEKKISRERELATDKIAGEISGPKNIATALVKIVAFSKYFDVIYDGMKNILKHGKQIINASCIFYEIVLKNVNKEVLKNIDGERLFHPIDTHPPLKLRLDALNCSLIDIEDSALNITKESSAIHLINKFDKVEENLTEIANYFIIKSLQDVDELKTKKEDV
ncbi:MAG: M48 family metallopeptidase [Candidatus Methanomethylicaceae archaeon]